MLTRYDSGQGINDRGYDPSVTFGDSSPYAGEPGSDQPFTAPSMTPAAKYF